MKTYVIYMSSNDFSVKMTEDTVASLEKFNIEYELFDGVVGNAGKDILMKHDIRPSAHIPVNEWTPGTVGCLASHFVLWDQCANQDEPFLIVEQDGVLVRDPRELLPEIKTVCHLDDNLPFNSDKKDPNYNHFEYYNSQIELYTPGVSAHPVNTFYGNKVTGITFRGTYGYIITPKGAREVIEFMKNYGAFPSDRCLCSNATDLQRSNSTYVRLNPFFQTLELQRQHSLRVPGAI